MSVRFDFDQEDRNPIPRRIALLRVSPELVLGLLQNHNDHRITSKGLPSDAAVVGADYDFQYRSFVLTLESPEFHEVPLGGIAPYIDVMLTDHGPWVASESV
jgi:hypothetical protein